MQQNWFLLEPSAIFFHLFLCPSQDTFLWSSPLILEQLRNFQCGGTFSKFSFLKRRPLLAKNDIGSHFSTEFIVMKRHLFWMGALYIQIMTVLKLLFWLLSSPLDFILIKGIIYAKGNYYQRRLKYQGISQALWSVCSGTVSHQSCPLWAAAKVSCIIVLTNGILVNIATGPLPACGSHVPQASSPVPVSCWWL